MKEVFCIIYFEDMERVAILNDDGKFFEHYPTLEDIQRVAGHLNVPVTVEKWYINEDLYNEAVKEKGEEE